MGHSIIHNSHLPQFFLTGSLGTRSISVIKAPRKIQDPYTELIKFVCLPNQPKPAFSANPFSSKEPSSTNILPSIFIDNSF